MWAYVQSVGSSRTDLEDPEHGIFKLRDTNGDWYWHARELPQSAFPTYFPNAAWANYMVATWAPAIKNLGFDGIHWDSLGRIAGDAGAETAGFHAFLRTAGALLRNYDLKQTFNFVDLAWWDRDLVVEALEFPYAECWSQASAIRYFEIMDDAELAQREGVFPMYPSVAVPAGSDETAVIGDRWNAALRHHLHYLVIGDGARRMKNQYWPETIALTPEEIAAIGGRR